MKRATLERQAKSQPDGAAVSRALAIVLVLLLIVGAAHYGILWRLAMPG